MQRCELMSLNDGSEVLGKLISVRRGKVVIEARRRFEIPAVEAPRSLRNALGTQVGILLIDGKVRWRFVRASPEMGVPKLVRKKRRPER